MAHHSRAASLHAFGSAGILALASGNLYASSFALIEQSVSAMGTAYAIGAAGIDDASTVFFNPAGMSRLPGTNLSGNLQIVSSNVDFKADAEETEYNTGNAALGPFGLDIAGQDIEGDTSIDTDLLAAVPSGYISYQAGERLWYGLGIDAHFGLKTDYDNKWVGRYNANYSELLTIDFNPSIALKLDDHTTVAFGISALFADGELSQVIDGGLLDRLAWENESEEDPVPGGDFSEGQVDLDAKLTGDDWGFGFNFGVLLEPSADTRLGLHYRSKIELEISGDSKVKLGDTVIDKQGARLPLTLPTSIALSGYHKLSPKYAVMADLTWTEWSKVNEVNITLADGRHSDNEWNYDDSIRVAVGMEYEHSADWILRAGLAFDESPVPDDSHRSPRVPDADRTWLSLGASYRYSPTLKLDFGYAHLFVDDPELDHVSDANDPTLPPPAGFTGFHVLTGEYDAAVDIIGMQVNWKMN